MVTGLKFINYIDTDNVMLDLRQNNDKLLHLPLL